MNSIPLFAKIIICVLLCELIGISSGYFTASGITEWYATLEKPSFNPPNWIFAPMWTILYAMMGIAMALIWDKGLHRSDVKVSLGVFGIQLVLNAAWSVLFFGLHKPAFALVDILFLVLMIVLTISLFMKVRGLAGILLVPYLLWVSFATVLNASIWYLNGGI